MSARAYLRASGVDPFGGESPVSAADREAIAHWLDKAAAKLALPTWDIAVSAGAVRGDTSNAETFLRDDAEEAVIALGESFFKWDEPHRRAILVHELLHCHFHPITKYARDMVEDELGQTAERFFDAGIGSLEEQTIDRLAKAIAPFLPVSPEPSEGT